MSGTLTKKGSPREQAGSQSVSRETSRIEYSAQLKMPVSDHLTEAEKAALIFRGVATIIKSA